MKLAAAEVQRALSRPDARRAGLLIHGEDVMRVALKRQEAVLALIGPQGAEEMRLTRMTAAELRRDPAMLADAVKAQGFFPGARAALVEEAGDAAAAEIGAALRDWREGDATIVVTAGRLTPKSALRKLFEDHPAALSVAVYDDPPGRAEIEAMLAAAGLAGVTAEAMADLVALSRAVDPGDLRQTIEKLALYRWGETGPATPEDVAACAPVSVEAELDSALAAAFEGEDGRIGPLIRRLEAQGVGAVTLCIGALRHLRTLHAAAAFPGGAAQGLARARPPVMGPRRDAMLRQLRRWDLPRLEQGLALLLDTDLALRSSTRAPQMALVERALMRLARLPGR